MEEAECHFHTGPGGVSSTSSRLWNPGRPAKDNRGLGWRKGNPTTVTEVLDKSTEPPRRPKGWHGNEYCEPTQGTTILMFVSDRR